MPTSLAFQVVKAALRDVIARCGGIERAAKMCGYGHSQIGRLADPNCDEPRLLDALIEMERDAGEPFVTRALAAATGHALVGASDAPSGACVITANADAIAAASDMIATATRALADGTISAAEAKAMDRAAREAEAAIKAFRKALAGRGRA